MKYFDEPSTVRLIDDFQKRTKPSPLLLLVTTHLFSNSISYCTWSSLASSAHVLAINTTDGSFSRIISTSSFPVHRFPSPWQFQTRRFIVIGVVEPQPPPNPKVYHLQSSKLVDVFEVNLKGIQLAPDFSSHSIE